MDSSISVLSKLSLVATMFAAGFTDEAQTQAIRIRVININNGHGLPHQNVSVTLLYGKDGKTPARYEANLRLETDANAEARFVLPEPVPMHLAAQVRLTSEHWRCGCRALTAAQDVIQKGIVEASSLESGGSAPSTKAEPGVILFFARPFTFLERLFYPLMKQ
jgi:hypothetical protein